MRRTVRTACTLHCGDGCSLLAETDGQRILSIRGNPDHPATKGFLCAKTTRFGERLNDPRRITTPLIREGGGVREASWEEALGLVAKEIGRLRKTPERMLHIHYLSSFGLVHQASKLLFRTLGTSAFSGSPCLAAGKAAQAADFGAMRQPPLEKLLDAARIVNWGRNAPAASVHLTALLTEAREKGVRILSIHPGDTDYGGITDETIILRPGTDRFLAAAVAKILLGHTDTPGAGFACAANGPAFLTLLESLSLDEMLAACAVTREQAAMAADWYARKGTSTLIGRGLQRYAYGGENIGCIDGRAMLAGQLEAGVYYSRQDLQQAQWDWTKASPDYSRTFSIASIASEVENADPPVEFVWTEGMNPVTQCPDSLATRRMLLDRFTVAVEPFMTDTARCARVILPPALMFEFEDIVKNDAHRFVNHSAKVMKPCGLSLPNFEIATRLGALLDPPIVYPPSPEVVIDAALSQGKLGTSLSRLREAGFLGVDMPSDPWPNGTFAHPDGLYRFPEALHPDNPGDHKFPLRLLSLVRRDSLHSQVPEQEQENPPRVFIGPECPAAKLLTASGPGPLHPALLETRLGAMEVLVAISDRLHPEAVVYPRGDWLAHGGCINRLIRPHVTDLGGQIAYYEERARLTPKLTANSEGRVL